jgi:hypothetical protein
VCVHHILGRALAVKLGDTVVDSINSLDEVLVHLQAGRI